MRKLLAAFSKKHTISDSELRKRFPSDLILYAKQRGIIYEGEGGWKKID